MTVRPSVDVLLVGASRTTPSGNATLATVVLIRAGTQLILVDTAGYNQRLALETSLRGRGLATSDITHVVLTHLHWDHCLNYDLFPDATFIVSRQEVASAVELPRRDRATPHFIDRILDQLSTIQLVDDGVEVAPQVECWATPGHTAGHLAVTVPTARGLAVVAGDAVPDLGSIGTGSPRLVFFDSSAAVASLTRIVEAAHIIVPGHDAPLVKGTNGSWTRRISSSQNVSDSQNGETSMPPQGSAPNR